MYLTYSCLQDESVLHQKKVQALYCACMDIFICMLFLCMLYYLRASSELMVEEWDMETVTAGDYTVFYKITKEQWDTFEHDEDTDPKSRSKLYAFLEDMIQSFESIVAQRPQVYKH